MPELPIENKLPEDMFPNKEEYTKAAREAFNAVTAGTLKRFVDVSIKYEDGEVVVCFSGSRYVRGPAGNPSDGPELTANAILSYYRMPLPVISAHYSEEFGCVMGSIAGPVTLQESRQFLNQARSVADAHPLCRRMLADCRRAEPFVRISDAPKLAKLVASAGFKNWRVAILFSPDRLLIEYVANAVADCGYTLKSFTDYYEALSWLREAKQDMES
jgi:hypothetical protein